MDQPLYAVLGCLTLDSVVTASGERFAGVCGGNVLYAAAGVAIWDRRVGMVTRAGSDYPEACLQEFEDGGIALDGVGREADRTGLHVAFAYRADGSRSRHLTPEVMARIPAAERSRFRDDTHEEERYLAFSPAASDIPATWLEGMAGVHLPQLRRSSHHALARALRQARPDLLITMDAWHATDGLVPSDRNLLEDVAAFLPSQEDAQRLLPGRAAAAAARDLHEHGARHVVVKLGAAGCHILTADDGAWQVPAYPAEVVDPTGAGDAFCGGFLVGLHETGDPVRAAIFGTVSASFVIEHSSPAATLTVDRSVAVTRRETVARGVRRAGASQHPVAVGSPPRERPRAGI